MKRPRVMSPGPLALVTTHYPRLSLLTFFAGSSVLAFPIGSGCGGGVKQETLWARHRLPPPSWSSLGIPQF